MINTSVVLPGLASLALLVPSVVLAASDNAFLTKAIQGDNSEMTLGRMAEQRGASAGTRDFGRMLVTDHTKARVAVLTIAKAHGVAPTTAAQPEAARESAKLAGLSGPAFDREFARYMVEDHKKDISDFEKQAASGDASTKALADRTLPDLRKHLATAERLSSASMGGKAE